MQIDNKGYAIPYQTERRHVVRCGINISSEARNISHLRAIDANEVIVGES